VDATLKAELKESQEAEEVVDTISGDEQPQAADKSPKGKLVVKEEMAEGRLKWASSATSPYYPGTSLI
jgi:hypothetical protein